jgi:hypothetical protein
MHFLSRMKYVSSLIGSSYISKVPYIGGPNLTPADSKHTAETCSPYLKWKEILFTQWLMKPSTQLGLLASYLLLRSVCQPHLVLAKASIWYGWGSDTSGRSVDLVCSRFRSWKFGEMDSHFPPKDISSLKTHSCQQLSSALVIWNMFVCSLGWVSSLNLWGLS